MEILDAVRCDKTCGSELDGEKDLRLVLQILGAEAQDGADRRRYSRCAYVARAAVELMDPMGHMHRVKAFSRDANQWGVGLVTQTVLPVGQNALLQIEGGDQVDVRARGCIVRCREVLPGWYEGAVLFEQEQSSLSPALIDR